MAIPAYKYMYMPCANWFTSSFKKMSYSNLICFTGMYNHSQASQKPMINNFIVLFKRWEGGGIMVEHRNSNREVLGSIPAGGTLSIGKAHLLPRALINTQEAVVSSRHDPKIVDWDIKLQNKQTNQSKGGCLQRFECNSDQLVLQV